MNGHGTQIGAITQDYDTEISPVANPEETGFEFKGWYSDT